MEGPRLSLPCQTRVGRGGGGGPFLCLPHGAALPPAEIQLPAQLTVHLAPSPRSIQTITRPDFPGNYLKHQ